MKIIVIKRIGAIQILYENIGRQDSRREERTRIAAQRLQEIGRQEQKTGR